MSSLDAEMRQPDYCITSGYMRLPYAGLVFFVLLGCRDKAEDASDSTRGSLPSASTQRASSTNWDVDAGSVMLVSMGNTADSAAVILPDVSDSTIASVQGMSAPVGGLVFDLFGRTGRMRSSVAVTVFRPDSAQDCYSWPLVDLRTSILGWRVGFASGRAHEIKLDSIEGVPSTDSAGLAVSLAQMAATLPIASDPTFRGLPFRVRSAYTFRSDSADVVIADVVRSVNEEANPRLEHLLIIGEKPVASTGRYTPSYYSRTAGAEETTQATEVLAAVRIGSSKRPAIIVSVEYEDGRRLGLMERTAPGQWRFVWRSAYTDC